MIDNSRKPEEERSGKDKVFDPFIKKSENLSKTVKKRISKRFREEDRFVIVYHGSGGERRPESFDFDKARESNDFGRAMYFGLTVKMARDWASLRKNGVVNWYLFKLESDSYHRFLQVHPRSHLAVERICRVFETRDHRSLVRITVNEMPVSRTNCTDFRVESMHNLLCWPC